MTARPMKVGVKMIIKKKIMKASMDITMETELRVEQLEILIQKDKPEEKGGREGRARGGQEDGAAAAGGKGGYKER